MTNSPERPQDATASQEELEFTIWQAFEHVGLPAPSSPPAPFPLTEEYLTLRIHVAFNELDLQQLAIIRQLTPAQRLARVFGLNASLRRLISASIHGQHPEIDAETLRQQLARRIGGFHARTRI